MGLDCAAIQRILSNTWAKIQAIPVYNDAINHCVATMTQDKIGSVPTGKLQSSETAYILFKAVQKVHVGELASMRRPLFEMWGHFMTHPYSTPNGMQHVHHYGKPHEGGQRIDWNQNKGARLTTARPFHNNLVSTLLGMRAKYAELPHMQTNGSQGHSRGTTALPQCEDGGEMAQVQARFSDLIF